VFIHLFIFSMGSKFKHTWKLMFDYLLYNQRERERERERYVPSFLSFILINSVLHILCWNTDNVHNANVGSSVTPLKHFISSEFTFLVCHNTIFIMQIIWQWVSSPHHSFRQTGRYRLLSSCGIYF